jgi:hypothetical protein
MAMKKLPLAGVAALAFMNAGHAQTAEIPQGIINEDWCMSETAPDVYYPIAGCKSLVIGPTTVTWNKPGDQATCTIRAKELLGGTHWWLTTSVLQAVVVANRFGIIQRCPGSHSNGVTWHSAPWQPLLRASRRLSLRKFNCATVNREALRARRTVMAGTGRQSPRPAQRYSVKTVRELSVAGPVASKT